MTVKKSNTTKIQITELIVNCANCGELFKVYIQSKFVKQYCRKTFKCYKCFSEGVRTNDAEGT